MKKIINLSLVAVGILLFSSGCATDSPDVDKAGETVMKTNTVYSSVLPEINIW